MSPRTTPRFLHAPAARPAVNGSRRWRAGTVAISAAIAAALVLPLSVHAAGEVEVRWVEPEQFRDAGQGSIERDRNLRTLEQHFTRLGRHLPDGQTLRVEVEDVDLAGEIWPFGFRDTRIVRGGVDWPQIDLRWTLSAGDRVLAQGEERVADRSYTFGSRVSMEQGPLPYERRMLEDWFRERIADEAAAGR
jgi:hypothetical protein